MMRPPPAQLNLDDRAEAVMARHAKTFNWANRLIPRDRRRDFARLYAFCRLADDLVDEASDRAQAEEAIALIRRDLDRGQSEIRAVAEFLELARRTGIPLDCPRELLTGVASDFGRVRIETQPELLRYAYRVASTVGLMVCHILDVRAPKALAYAIDLGLAMQMTNIARDVVEDWHNDRVYLPADWIPAERVGAAVSEDAAARQETWNAIQRLLDLADGYYRSADRGIAALPFRIRWGILAASRCYEAIGTLIRRRDRDYWTGRTFTGTRRKLYLTARAAMELLCLPRFWSPRWAPDHDQNLHTGLEGLPGAHPPPDPVRMGASNSIA